MTSQSSTPRFILVDDNIRDVGGHYFELATLLLGGAKALGYQPVLATNADFEPAPAMASQLTVLPCFHTRRLVRWSLGVDGNSQHQRDISGNVLNAGGFDKLRCSVSELLTPPAKRPKRMLDQWSADLQKLIAKLKPTSNDHLLINTGDDFAMLALAKAMQGISVPTLRIDVIFHFALYEHGQQDRKQKLRAIGRQIRSAGSALKPHQIHLHATTDALATQLRESESGFRITSIPYPTRRRKVDNDSSEPIKAVLAGLPRAEKGRGAIADLLTGVEKSLLKDGRFQMSMQMPEERWQNMVPTSLHRAYQRAVAGQGSGPLEVMTSNLETADYHRWLDTADLGIFLYEPKRYVARCSGVLLEMLVRGVPVIVPDGCWLSEQVRLAGGHRSIGMIYQDRAEIPDLMRQFANKRSEIQPRSIAYATTITQRHDSRNTLTTMGIQPANQRQQAA